MKFFTHSQIVVPQLQRTLADLFGSAETGLAPKEDIATAELPKTTVEVACCLTRVGSDSTGISLTTDILGITA